MPVYGLTTRSAKLLALIKILISVFPEDREQQGQACLLVHACVNEVRLPEQYQLDVKSNQGTLRYAEGGMQLTGKGCKPRANLAWGTWVEKFLRRTSL